MEVNRTVAYFSMEIAIEEGMPTYSGGLGILAGDTIRSAATLHVPMVCITLLHRKGYFFQKLDERGWQKEASADWVIEDFLTERPERIRVNIEGRTVLIRVWEYQVLSADKFNIPVYFLDADLSENSEWDRTLTHYLYGGDQCYRLCQEVILGIGGVRILRAMGYDQINRFHMNEGHASLLTLELLDESSKQSGRTSITIEDVEVVKKLCVFTTHTPVEAGHDKFPMALVEQVLGHRDIYDMKNVFCCEGILNTTLLGFNLSHYINGVAKKHGEVAHLMFAKYSIDSITNGVHALTWTSDSFQRLFGQHIPGWAEDNFSLRYALSIPKKEIWDAHMKSKGELLEFVNRQTNLGMDLECLTIGFARRAASYKRADLLLSDVNRLKKIANTGGPIQIIYGGKAHPQDRLGKELIQKIFQLKEVLKNDIKVTYLENYDIALAKLMTAGVDIWLNTPQTPFEASGTSGMKAALNGVPSLSILDGWWVEGCIEGITGWSIGKSSNQDKNGNNVDEVDSLLNKLETVIIPMFYHERESFIEVMIHCIALNGSFFNTQRMVQQYIANAYFR